MADFSDPTEYADLRAAVREITAAHGPAEFAEHGRAGIPQSGLWADLGRAGFIGINVPAQYGGGGAGMSELVVVAEESAAGGSPLLLLLVSSAIAVEVLAKHGSEQQKQEWLTRLADGSVKVAFAITEPDAGSNSHHIITAAVRDGDDYLLSGSKYYISGVDDSAAILTVARTGVDETTGKARISLFMVPTSAPGLSWNPLPVAAQIPDKQFTVFYDQVRVPASALIGVEGEGLKPLFDGLNPERIAGAALGVGIGRYAVELASRYATGREVWGTPIGAHQGVAHPLAKAKIEVELAALMTAKAAWLHDRGLPAGEASNMAKYAAAEAAVAAVDAAIQTHGGNGMSVEYGLIPLWGMARLLQIAPVSREMLLNYVAHHTLRLPRSY
ncbi:Acyl-CoA dehydrogenase [Nakamurella panacisegetis]|uniref:Acyl-CoA dehydrogenase n=1 Tax=Nakamurella panacisegetis TaxID=1090615 RepID=A0A1H0HVK0_9ACTN|nr:acyl-CoA dehydrogenase family protein [Nakamurella panacisegetis]SDO23208.1 Acyl-CoA dehydrogenase [Nakamurella panacisegetis]